ncbi:hypothetical protein HW130_07075 [Streptomyces sp. PKU-EA00015]|uniref:hypothetical protein n=1 Tax=Streptomyces sp. PKU-EA00015 TaxID=2748326 RepID=UPI0015A47E9D|nr:hypothetical protein [Streptomyces sp. PKU-EA00015]NWF26032.1 hypothetical protein [Streptomyces sp. PKU-EA00015]
MAEHSPSAIALLRALAEGKDPTRSREALEAWDNKWAAIFQRAIDGEGESAVAELAGTLERLTNTVAQAREAKDSAAAKRRFSAKRATRKNMKSAARLNVKTGYQVSPSFKPGRKSAQGGSAYRDAGPAAALPLGIRYLSVGKEFELRTESGVRVAKVVEVPGSKGAALYRPRDSKGREVVVRLGGGRAVYRFHIRSVD